MRKRIAHDIDVRYVDAIFCADMHLRETAPRCRRDNFRKAMISKIALLRRLQERYNCPVFVAGDVFHTWRCGHWLTRFALKSFPKHVYAVPGQHELPSHRMDMIERSPFAVLEAAGNLTRLTPSPSVVGKARIKVAGAGYGEEESVGAARVDVLVLHKMVWHTDKPFPDVPLESEAVRVMQMFPHAKTIVTGDNHKPFVVRHKGRVLVNCGSMMRTTVDQADYQPVFWLWTMQRNRLQQVRIEVDHAAVTEDEKVMQQSESSFTSFLREVEDVESLGVSFEDNMKQFIQSTPQPQGVSRLIWEAIDG